MGAPARITDFLLRLRAWQYSIASPEMNAESVAEALKLRPTAGSVLCNHMIYNDAGEFFAMCQQPCLDKSPWCGSHGKMHTMGQRNTGREPSVVPLFHLPRHLAYQRVTMVGYFEHRWKSDDWACSLQTLQDQAKQAGVGVNTLGTLRFVGFVDENDQLLVTDLKGIFPLLEGFPETVSVLQTMHVLLVELLIGLELGFTIRQWIRVFPWLQRLSRRFWVRSRCGNGARAWCVWLINRNCLSHAWKRATHRWIFKCA